MAEYLAGTFEVVELGGSVVEKKTIVAGVIEESPGTSALDGMKFKMRGWDGSAWKTWLSHGTPAVAPPSFGALTNVTIVASWE